MATNKFHLSLNVQDIATSAAFLELLLGTRPTQLHPNYAKFELIDPALVLSLVSTDIPTSGGINHLGFRLPNREALDVLQTRLQTANVRMEFEESVACCHSRQTKFWVHDPAGNLWEFYVLEEVPTCDSPMPQTVQLSTQPAVAPTEERVWSHRLGDPLPDRIPAPDASLTKIVLEGTLNDDIPQNRVDQLLQEAARSLAIGRTLLIRGLTADCPLSDRPALPGPAAIVRHVPLLRTVLDAVESAGFVEIELLALGESYTFTHAGATLRETRLQAKRGASERGPATRLATYRGPFAEVRDESGQVFPRGETVSIDDATHTRLTTSNAADRFVFGVQK